MKNNINYTKTHKNIKLHEIRFFIFISLVQLPVETLQTVDFSKKFC